MWFRIKAYERDIGRDITFWLWGDDEKHIRSILSQKHNITDIKYIEQLDMLYDSDWINDYFKPKK